MTQLRDQLQTTLSGSYTLERELGGGGMSRVFVAEELRLKRRVVVKVLSPELAQGISVERFEREIQTAAALQQANIVPILSAGDTNGLPFYTMPLVEGESLRARLGRGPLAVTEVIGILRDVSKALAYAHQHGVVHRDIKPDNVLLSGGTAVVTDFGIAKALSAARTASGSATLTQIGTSIGTPAYMAPEQAAGDPDIDARADIYSLGAMAYELLSGRVVFADRTAQRMLAAHMGEAPAPITTFRADLPASLADLVMACLAKDPAGRPQSAGDIARVLETITSGSGMQAMPPILLGGPGMFRKALLIYVAAFAAVAILAKAAIVGIGLPDWVFPGALVLMALGLPMVLWTAYVQRVTRRAMMMTPTYTPGGTPSMAGGTIATMAFKAAPHVSWYRTARGGLYALGVFVLMIAVFMSLRALGIGPAGSLFASGALNVHDRVLVDDFRSPGADSSLGRVVSEGLRTNLAQSHAISVVSASSVADGLQRMQRPTTTPLDLSLARQLAEREGIKVVVDGELTPAGQGFILSVRLVAAASGDVLATFHAAARDATDLIPAIDRITRDVRGRVGESLRAVHASPALAQVTTTSLPALRKYTEGMALHYRDGRFADAAVAFEQAIRLDSGFVMAYDRAANSYGNEESHRVHADSLREIAFRMRERLPELERTIIEASHFRFGERRDSAIAAGERAIAIDPSQSVILNVLGLDYTGRHEYVRAESTFRRAMAIGDGNGQPWANLVYTLVDAGKFSEAAAAISETVRRFPRQSSAVLGAAAAMALARGRFDSVAVLLDSAGRGPRDRLTRGARYARADFASARGQLRDGERRLAATVAEDEKAGATPQTGAAAAIQLVLDSIGNDVWIRERPRADAVRRLDAILSRFPKTGPTDITAVQLLGVAQWYAIAGRADRARAVMTRYGRDVRDSATLRLGTPWLHVTTGEIAIAEHRYPDAIAAFRAVDVYYDGRPVPSTIFRDAVLGRAFDLAGMRDSAIAAFARYVATPYMGRWGFDAQFLAGSYKRLGELYEEKGDSAKAAASYRAFIELWKNADPELQPRVAEARRRLAKLTPVEKPR